MSSRRVLDIKRLRTALAVLAALSLVLSFIVPRLLTADYYTKSLKLLRGQAASIKKDFANILKDQGLKLRRAAGRPWPATTELRFQLFKDLGLDPEVEGVAACAGDGHLTLWLGNVLNLEAAIPGGIGGPVFQEFGQTLLLKYKASSYLVSLHWVDEQTLLVLCRLLAFSPEFKSPYLEDYQFLRPGLRKNCSIDYWDFRDDVSVFNRNFARHQDEYIGQPRLQGDVLSLFFPLRNERSQILGTVTLRSPTLTASLSSQKEAFLALFYVFLAAALVLLLIEISRRPAFLRERRMSSGLAALFVLAALRLLFFAFSRLERVQALPIFSPTRAGFFSLGNLTQSPGDIVLTSLALFVFFVGLAFYVPKIARPRAVGPAAGIQLLVLAFSAGLLVGFQDLISKLVFNASVNLLKFSLSGTFLVLHFSLVLAAAGCAFLVSRLVQFPAGIRLPQWTSALLFLGAEAAVFLVCGRGRPGLFLLQSAALAVLVVVAFFKKPAARPAVLGLMILSQIFLIYGTLHQASSAKSRSLMEHFLKNTIQSQEDWARFILDQSFRELDKQKNDLLAFLKDPQRVPDPTHTVWKRTLAAKFNWYSELEILDDRGTTLARFSLNVPKVFRVNTSQTPILDWTVSRLTIPFMGKEKDFLVGAKDWESDGNRLGRTIFYLSLDYDLLPFLYSANPYFELLRVNSLPSMNEYDFRMAVFDLGGRILFNPHKISTGLSPALISALAPGERGLWTTFLDKGNPFHLYAFRSGNRIFTLFSLRKSFVQKAIDYFKLLFLYAAIFLLPAFLIYLLHARKRIQHPLWSFANRVYISFMAVALVPLFLFSFFSRSFFTRIFTQQFVEKAEIHANLARSVMDDYIFFQQQEKIDVQTPPEDLMLWISTTIANDVNLYEEGRLVSSSRSEFFDQGLFPELLSGEIYYQIQFENNPYYTQKRNIGTFTFQTLTVPYSSLGRRLMISLPFPFEQEEISGATRDLIEFFLLIAVFFIATVFILARWIGAMIVTPIHKLLAGTREAGLGNLDFAIEHRSRDEMKTLIDGFNAMIKNLRDHQRELADLGKKAAWAEMARKVAHEIKNPLTPIQLSAEHLLRVYEDKRGDFDQALKESISYIIGEVENLRRIAHEFLEISKEAVLHKEVFDFDALVRETVEPYKNVLTERIQFRETFEGADFRIEGDRPKLKIALRNLLTNAIEAIQGRGEIRVRLTAQPGWLVLRIDDTGTGIEKDILDRIFEPYFSTKDVGTGLGLPIARKIVEDHRGSIEISSEPGRGTKVTIRLPSAKT
ncbi:MAG: HAMP domain-containing sensor histidine kinase [Candidatus Aminicenantes bacterium]|nr:HAMP domain-containing sensor histidine kinase [Candidatus Aminicenantes bacterium]